MTRGQSDSLPLNRDFFYESSIGIGSRESSSERVSMNGLIFSGCSNDFKVCVARRLGGRGGSEGEVDLVDCPF